MEENIGLCKKCGNCDYLSEENLCSRCAKHEPELKCCGEHLDIYENHTYPTMQRRVLKARCVVCSNDYIIMFKDKSIKRK